MSHSVYSLRCTRDCSELKSISDQFQHRLWRPSLFAVKPAGLPLMPFVVWWIFHQLRVFANRDYGIFVVYDGLRLIHRSCIFPRYFRFPFMSKDDLQIGDTWTDPSYRGQGLAKFGLQEAVRQSGQPGRRFWYVVDDDNAPSINVVETAGFTANGEVRRTRRCGLRLLGGFVVENAEHATPV